MTDVFDQETRSRIMSKVKSEDTKPEMKVRSLIHKAGFRFRLHQRNLPGNPDLVLPKYRIAVFVHGCFWHGHECSRFRWPKSNSLYWRNKIERNRKRDLDVKNRLQELGWIPYVIWTCDLEEGTKRLIKILNNLTTAKKKDDS